MGGGVWGETPRNHVENIHGGFGGIIVIKNFQVVFLGISNFEMNPYGPFYM